MCQNVGWRGRHTRIDTYVFDRFPLPNGNITEPDVHKGEVDDRTVTVKSEDNGRDPIEVQLDAEQI